MQWADTGQQPEAAFDLRRDLAARSRSQAYGGDDWAYAASGCLQEHVAFVPYARSAHRIALADTYREFFTNPFVYFAWDLSWQSSTVRDLAAHVYAKREFGTMPILADALQDASCDNERVLAHCRANKPHTRGCWVLDAILGKS